MACQALFFKTRPQDKNFIGGLDRETYNKRMVMHYRELNKKLFKDFHNLTISMLEHLVNRLKVTYLIPNLEDKEPIITHKSKKSVKIKTVVPYEDLQYTDIQIAGCEQWVRIATSPVLDKVITMCWVIGLGQDSVVAREDYFDITNAFRDDSFQFILVNHLLLGEYKPSIRVH
jgi:hypothetical protein